MPPPPLILFSPFTSNLVVGIYPDTKYAGHLRLQLEDSSNISLEYFLTEVYPKNPTQNQALHNHIQEHFPEYLV